MKHENKYLYDSRNEKGSVLIVALIMLMLITIMGISATTTTEIELQIAGNDIIYKRNLYASESAAMEGIQLMEDTDLETSAPTWLTTVEDVIDDDDVRTDSNWSDNFTGNVGSIRAGSASDSKVIAVFEGMDEIQESLDVSKTRIHSYSIFGRSNQQNGEGIVKLGYRKAF